MSATTFLRRRNYAGETCKNEEFPAATFGKASCNFRYLGLAKNTRIHMGEWRTKYDNRDTMDGVQWSVDIEYENDMKPTHYWGSNKFPYNFDRFLEIMEME